MNISIAYAAVLVVAASLIVGLPADAEACSLDEPRFEVVPDPTDVDPPPAPVLRVGAIQRGRAGESEGCGGAADEDPCQYNRIGSITVEVVEPAGEPIGYVLDRADFPANVLGSPLFGTYGRTFGGSENGRFWVFFDDGATDDQEPLSFTFSVRAVDQAGNVSIEPAILMVDDPGTGGGGGGCTVAGGATPWALVIGMLLADRSMRARRRDE